MENMFDLTLSLIHSTDWVETPLEDLESYIEVEVDDEE